MENAEVLLSVGQYNLIYNAFSFTFATMAAATLFFWLGRSQVAPPYKLAVTITGLVTAIAAYHYWRILGSWDEAYKVVDGTITATGYAFNDAYRYVDWLLTVPLLLIELILVMRLSRDETTKRATRLGLAAALMIALGYPGEIAETNAARAVWGAASSVPFLYIVYELFRGLGESIKRQPDDVKPLVENARLLTFASWGFYPIVYMAPFVGLTGGGAETVIQIGYTIADIVAKAVFGVLIFVIALRKSQHERGDEPAGTVQGGVAQPAE